MVHKKLPTTTNITEKSLLSVVHLQQFRGTTGHLTANGTNIQLKIQKKKEKY